MRLKGNLVAALWLLSLPAMATNGYFAHGYSLAQKALGGAGTASVEDPLIVTVNPAATAFTPQGLTAGLSLFTPIRDFRADAPEGQAGIVTIAPGFRRSQNEYYPLPAVAYNRALGDWGRWGVAMFGNGGLNTEYVGHSAQFADGLPLAGTECAGTFGGGAPVEGQNDPVGFCGNGKRNAGVDLAILYLTPSLAVKLGERSALGVAPIFALSRFAARGLSAFAQFSNAPDKVSDNGHDLAYGVGYRIGGFTALIPAVRLGASYQGRVRMGEFDDYAGLFAEQGDFDIPESWNLGVVLRLTPRHQLLFDYQRINFSQIRSVGNPMDPNRFVNQCALPRLLGSTATSEACLGAATGPGFGWQDMTVRKFGYQYAAQRWKLRLGFSTARQPIPASEVLFNVLAPGVIEQHFTAGFSWRLSSLLELEMAAMFAPDRTVTGQNPLSNVDLVGGLPVLGGSDQGTFGTDPQDQELHLNMRQYELSIGFTWHLE